MKKIALFAIVLVLLFVGTIECFTYWDNTVNSINSTSVDIGSGSELDVVETAVPESGKFLIPVGAFQGEDDVYSYTYGYQVTFNKGTLKIRIKDIMINGILDTQEFIITDIYAYTTIVSHSHELELDNGSDEECIADVSVVLSLRMPDNEAEYDFVKNGHITFVAEFSLE